MTYVEKSYQYLEDSASSIIFGEIEGLLEVVARYHRDYVR